MLQNSLDYISAEGQDSLNKFPGYDTKQSDGETPDWEMRSTSLWPSLPGPLSPGVVAPDEVLSMGQITV